MALRFFWLDSRKAQPQGECAFLLTGLRRQREGAIRAIKSGGLYQYVEEKPWDKRLAC